VGVTRWVDQLGKIRLARPNASRVAPGHGGLSHSAGLGYWYNGHASR
jgi:hypothetical protein